jgi:hypothetical protein
MTPSVRRHARGEEAHIRSQPGETLAHSDAGAEGVVPADDDGSVPEVGGSELEQPEIARATPTTSATATWRLDLERSIYSPSTTPVTEPCSSVA